MEPETNPYRSPTSSARLLDRFVGWAVLSDLGWLMQAIVFAIYIFISIESDQPPSIAIANTAPSFHAIMATFSIVGLSVCVLSTFRSVKWSIYRRVALMGTAIVVFCVTAFISHLFGVFA